MSGERCNVTPAQSAEEWLREHERKHDGGGRTTTLEACQAANLLRDMQDARGDAPMRATILHDGGVEVLEGSVKAPVSEQFAKILIASDGGQVLFYMGPHGMTGDPCLHQVAVEDGVQMDFCATFTDAGKGVALDQQRRAFERADLELADTVRTMLCKLVSEEGLPIGDDVEQAIGGDEPGASML